VLDFLLFNKKQQHRTAPTDPICGALGLHN